MVDEVPVINGEQLDEKERGLIGGFIEESGYVDTSTEFIQCEVPIGLQRISNIDGFDDPAQDVISFEDIVSKGENTDIPRGFIDSSSLSPHETAGGNIDVIIVKENEIGIIELKYSIKSLNDVHPGFGQLMMYKEMFEEDYNAIRNEVSVSLNLVVGDWNISKEMVGPSFEMKGVNLYDVSDSKWVIEPGRGEIPQNQIWSKNPDTLKNYDVPLAIATGGSAHDIAEARRIMDNIDPYEDLSVSDFEKFDDIGSKE